MEVVYAKLYDKYTKLKANRFAEMDDINKDQEVKFVKYMAVAEEMMEFLKKENDELRILNNELRNEVASMSSSKDEQIAEYQSLLMEENQKNRELTEELKKLQNLQLEGFENKNKHRQLNTPESAHFGSKDLSNGSARQMSRKRGRHTLATSGQEGESVADLTTEAITRGDLVNTQQAEYSRRIIGDSGGVGIEDGSTHFMYQFLVGCLLGMKISTSNKKEGLVISALHESSGYSISLTTVNFGAKEEAELFCRVISLGTLERVAPECMKEDIMLSKIMCPIFFERVSRVINYHT